jgi:hypothetical protein
LLRGEIETCLLAGREIPPLREADSFARAKEKKKRRLAPVGMTAGFAVRAGDQGILK